MPLINWSDFEKIDIRIGTIEKAEVLEGARKPAYKLLINFGEVLGLKKSSVQITHYYSPEMLTGQQVVAVINIPPKQIGNFFSECLVLGIYDQGGEVVLLQPERAVKNGSKIG